MRVVEASLLPLISLKCEVTARAAPSLPIVALLMQENIDLSIGRRKSLWRRVADRIGSIMATVDVVTEMLIERPSKVVAAYASLRDRR